LPEGVRNCPTTDSEEARGVLLAFRTTNHKSLRDEQVFDLHPVYGKGRPALTVAALYGANASGASNVLDALRFMHGGVTERNNRWKPGEGVPRKPFLLDRDSRGRPSSFSVELLLGGVRYVYGFSVDDTRILEEWCFSHPKKQRRILFERRGQQFAFGASVRTSESNLLTRITPENALFIASAHRAQAEPFSVVSRWFHDSLRFLDPADDDGWSSTHHLLGEEKSSRSVVKLFHAADLGIRDVRLERPAAGRQEGLVPVFTHTGKSGADFAIEDESRGTRAWFALLGGGLRTLREGWTLLIDDMDGVIHPLLLEQFVQLFRDRTTNPEGAQLVFTSHDVSLLGRRAGEEKLGRDEIWFTEKGHDTGASTLFSLADFRPGDGWDWEKRYLGGAVGAVPIVDEQGIRQAVRDVAVQGILPEG
jgi:uncharacterized protein